MNYLHTRYSWVYDKDEMGCRLSRKSYRVAKPNEKAPSGMSGKRHNGDSIQPTLGAEPDEFGNTNIS